MREQLAKNAYIVAGQASPEDALSAGSYPASGSYVDVAGYESVEVVVHLGAIHASDTPTFKVQQTTATNGATLDTISTANCSHACGATDDDKVIVFHLETATLADDHHFITTTVSGVTNGSYGDIMYYLTNPRHAPVTQSTTLIETTLTHAG